jgi:hypothetical protein
MTQLSVDWVAERATEGKLAMMKIIGGVPVKTRLPLTAWGLAALVALFSMISSLLDFGPASMMHASASW